jgi:hypothetical protein
MNISIEVHQDEKFNFFSEYDKLGNLQKDIWRAAVWWVKRFPCAHPRQSKIAEKVGCTREHVNRAFSKFKKLGWLYLTSRGRRRTKILGIPLHLQSLDIVKREYFARIEITSKITHSYSRLPKRTSRGTGDSFHELQIPSYLEETKFTLEQRLKLSMIPENFYRNGIESVNYQIKKGRKIPDPCGYVVGAALRMAEKAGVFLDWKRYYSTVPRKAA